MVVFVILWGRQQPCNTFSVALVGGGRIGLYLMRIVFEKKLEICRVAVPSLIVGERLKLSLFYVTYPVNRYERGSSDAIGESTTYS